MGQDLASISDILNKSGAQQACEEEGLELLPTSTARGHSLWQEKMVSLEEKLGFSSCLSVRHHGGCSCAAGHARQPIHLALSSLWSYLLVCSDLLIHAASQLDI